MHSKAKRLPPEIKKAIVTLYTQGIDGTELAERYGVAQTTVYNTLKRHGVKRRDGRFSDRRLRKYTLDDTYFDHIDTEEKAYWLGFLYADGHITLHGDVILELAAIDKEHIVKLNRCLRSTYPVKDTKSHTRGKITPSARLNIRSHHMSASLTKHGVGPDKSRVFNVPQLDESLERHFWRGVIDGDGSVSHAQNKTDLTRKVLNLTLAGNKPTIDAFVAFLKRRLGYDIGVHNNSWCRASWSCAVRGTKADAIARLLYDEASVYLERKMTMYRTADLSRSSGWNQYSIR